jgi:hypothetical protein
LRWVDRPARRRSFSRSQITTVGISPLVLTGYLYIGLGDGGSGDDPGHRAQTPSELLGKDVSVDVSARRWRSDRLPRAR